VIVGAPKEVKDQEARVGLVPSGVMALRESGHKILVQAGAGEGSSIPNEDYERAGAEIVGDPAEIWRRADLVVKVKEPQPSEYPFLRPGLTLFTYLHLAPTPELTRKLLEARVNAVAYETIREADGSLPLLTPMSEVAGRLSVQIGAQYLERPNGGRGVLLGGVPGVTPAEVVILGGGVVGTNAAKIALGFGARVTVIDRSLKRLRELDDMFHGRLITVASNPLAITEALKQADLVIGAVLIPGASAPRLVRREMISQMRRGSVIVDVSIDQGGCLETSRPTTHSYPIYWVDGVLHYCVANIPAAVPRTSTFALTNATFPYVHLLADLGLDRALKAIAALRSGVNTYRGELVHPSVAESQGVAWHDLALVAS
jgi:alanine dehydrogenase